MEELLFCVVVGIVSTISSFTNCDGFEYNVVSDF